MDGDLVHLIMNSFVLSFTHHTHVQMYGPRIQSGLLGNYSFVIAGLLTCYNFMTGGSDRNADESQFQFILNSKFIPGEIYPGLS